MGLLLVVLLLLVLLLVVLQVACKPQLYSRRST
jgi:hypothetical protein